MAPIEERSPRWTWYSVSFLLLLCLIRGLWVTRDLQAPAIMDTFRDAGFVQGIVDGNWFGDPAIAGAWRYYPPLIHAIFACLSGVTGISPLRLLMSAAPWVNLIVPLGFFLMCRRLIGAAPAVFGMTFLILFNGLVLPPWVSAAYHPWSSIPILALGGFFFTVWLIRSRIHSEKHIDAALIGSAIGLTFLAHTVPAVILAAILPVVAVVAKGFRLKTLVWIAIAGLVSIAWTLPLMLPLLVSYRLLILNGSPGAFVDPLFAVWPSRAMLLTLLPGVLSLPVIGLLRSEASFTRESLAVFAVWILVPSLFLSRHYACAPASHAMACTIFVLAVHHWFIYLQAALTGLAGFAAWLCARRVARIAELQPAWNAAGWAMIAISSVIIFSMRPSDVYMRLRAQKLGEFFDWNAYSWVLEHTTPRDLFVTELTEESLNAASVAVMAAGRPSVALAATYSNPYVDWESRSRRSLLYLTAARSRGQRRNVVLCDLLGEAGNDANAYLILPTGQTVTGAELQRDSVGPTNTIYRALPEVCTQQDSPRLTAAAMN